MHKNAATEAHGIAPEAKQNEVHYIAPEDMKKRQKRKRKSNSMKFTL